jgi:hypothetical protein
MKIFISATGFLKSYVPMEQIITVDEGDTLEQIKDTCGIPSSVLCCYTVNNKLAKATTLIKNGDHIKFLMVAGGG